MFTEDELICIILKNDYGKHLIVRDAKTPLELLIYLSNDESKYIRMGVAENTRTPQQTLRKLSCDKEIIVRICVIDNPNTSIEILEKMIKENDNSIIHKLIASNPKLSNNSIEYMSKMKNVDIRRAIKENPSTPKYIVDTLNGI